MNIQDLDYEIDRTAQSINVIWGALNGIRESLLPEFDSYYEFEWREIVEAMQYIENQLNRVN
jgi:hypothetical protein